MPWMMSVSIMYTFINLIASSNYPSKDSKQGKYSICLFKFTCKITAGNVIEYKLF